MRSKILVALCLNKVFCFIMPLYKIFTMYSIYNTCIFNAVKKPSGIGFIVALLTHCWVTLHVYRVRQIPFFWKCLKKTTKYFLKFSFYMTVKSFRLIINSELSNFSSLSFREKPLCNQKLLPLTVTY